MANTTRRLTSIRLTLLLAAAMGLVGVEAGEPARTALKISLGGGSGDIVRVSEMRPAIIPATASPTANAVASLVPGSNIKIISSSTEKSPDAEAEDDNRADTAGDAAGQSVMEQLIAGIMPVKPEDFGSDDGPEHRLTLREVVMSVLRNNHDVRIAAHRPDQARADVMDAKSAYDPEAFFEWEHSRDQNYSSFLGATSTRVNRLDTEKTGVRQHLPTGGSLAAYREWNQGGENYSGSATEHGHGGAYALELSQPLLKGFGDRENRATIEISNLQVDRSEEELRLTVIQSPADSFEAYWNVALANEEIRIQEETLKMAEALLEREQQRREEGISTPLDVNRASEAVASRGANLFYARDQQQLAQERLKLFLNSPALPIGKELRIIPVDRLETPPVKPNLEKSIETALANRPEMRNADLVIRTGVVRRGFAKHNLLPKLDVVGSVRRNDRNSNTPSSSSTNAMIGNDWSLGLAFSMPIGNMKARANLRKAESELAQVVDEKSSVKSVIATEVKMAVKTLELVIREIPVSQQAAEAALKVVEGEWARFELNQVSNRDLLQAQDLLAVAARNRVQTLVRYNVALARLLEAEGTLLDHIGVRLGK